MSMWMKTDGHLLNTHQTKLRDIANFTTIKKTAAIKGGFSMGFLRVLGWLSNQKSSLDSLRMVKEMGLGAC